MSRLAQPAAATRVGAIVAPGSIPAWVAASLRAIAELPGVSLSALIIDERAASAHRFVPESRLLDALVRLDRRVFTSKPSAFALSPIDAVLPEVPRHRWHTAVSRAERGALLTTTLGLDVAIDFAGAASASEREPGPPLGVWSFSHDGGSAGLAACSAVLRDCPTIASDLRVAGTPPRRVCCTISASDHASVSRALDGLLWKAAGLAPHALRRLAAEGPEAFRAGFVPAPNAPSLSAGRVLAHGPRHLARYAGTRRDHARAPRQWILLRGVLTDGQLSSVRRIVPPADRFWADPFVAVHDGRRFVFFEELPYSTGRGHLAVCELDARGEWTNPRTVLMRPYHLSYPFVFSHEGQWYLLPETSGNRTIELYRCDRFPDQWRLHHVLMRDVRAVDTTLVEHGGRWWLFTNIAEFAGSLPHDELHVFWADDPLAPVWTPHPLNPVVSDVRRARGAGRILDVEGRLVRPSQDCAREYGRAIRLNEVVALDRTTYREDCVGVVEPDFDPDIVAVHTWTPDGAEVWLDGKLKRPAGAGDLAPAAERRAAVAPPPHELRQPC